MSASGSVPASRKPSPAKARKAAKPATDAQRHAKAAGRSGFDDVSAAELRKADETLAKMRVQGDALTLRLNALLARLG